MFGRDFLCTIKIMFRAKTSLFWTLVFPILLSTFMYMAFGNIFEKDEMFSHINVAVVTEDNSENGIKAMLDALSEGDDALLAPKYMNKEEAQEALEAEKVDGIIYTDSISLEIAKNSINATILETVLSEYKQYEYAISGIVAKEASKGVEPDMDRINGLVTKLTNNTSYYTEKASTEGSQNNMYNYFYAIFAMSCLFAALSSLKMMNNLQANLSATGMRKNVSSNRKVVFILAEFMALLLIHFVVEVISLGYMALLGIKFGPRIPEIMLTLFVGCVIGLALGVIIGALSRLGEGAKTGLLIGVSMLMSILADLCAHGIKHEIALHAPIINKINPAALISDTFYALNVYSDHKVFTENIIIMSVEAVVLVTIGMLMVRRNRYASI